MSVAVSFSPAGFYALYLNSIALQGKDGDNLKGIMQCSLHNKHCRVCVKDA